MTRKLQEIINGLEPDLNVSMMLKCLKTGKVGFCHDENRIVSSASTIKIPILIQTLRLCAENELDLEDELRLAPENRADFSRITETGRDYFTVRELLFWMITVSDNSATNQLIDLCGMEGVNGLLLEMGFKDTVLRRKMMDLESRAKGIDNLTSAAELAGILESLYNGRFLPGFYTGVALDFLGSQRDKDGLLRYLPEDVKIASKTGSLDGLANDAGILFPENGPPYVIAVCTDGFSDEDTGWRIIGRLSESAYYQSM